MTQRRLKTLKKRISGPASKRYMFFIAIALVVGLGIFIFSVFGNTSGHSSSSSNSSQDISVATDKEVLLYRAFEQELQKLNNPFALFGVTTQKLDAAGVCREIASLVENGPTRYQEAERCDLQQGGEIVLSTDANRQAIAAELQKTNLDELFINKGWQYDDYYKQNHGVTNQRLEYILGNIDSILQQANSQDVQPDALGATYYIKKIDAKTTCRFTENEQAGAKDGQTGQYPVTWDKIMLNLSMICNYDNT